MSSQIQETRTLLWNQTLAHYQAEELLSANWWLIVAFLIILYALWWKSLDKSRLAEILLFGSFTAVIATIADVVGVTMVLWQYNTRLFPISPAVFPFDYSAIPILLMMAYQRSPSWAKFFMMSAISAAVFSFAFLPTAELLGIIQLFNWSFVYTFALMLINAAFCKWTIQKVFSVQRASRRVHPGTYSEMLPLPQPMAKPLSEKEDEKSGP